VTTYKESNDETEAIKFVRNQRKENVETEMKSKTKLLLIGLMLVGLSGCATGRYGWTHPAFVEQTYRVDSYECERDMRQSGYFGRGLVGEMNGYAFNARCMQARGYSWVKVE
jgi:hypothetical protein